jgi:Bacterial SH3 domain
MIGKSTMRTRLCPNCANSVQEEAANCPYCKADLSSGPAPQWLNRDEPSSEPRPGSNHDKRSSIPSKFIWPAAMVIVALTAFFAGGYMQRGELSLATQKHLKEIQAKDQMIQSQEAQLAQTKQQLNERSTQLAEMKTKFEEGRKELAAAQQRLSAATRKVNRLTSTRSVAVARSASRAPYANASYSAPAAARRTVDPGVYETTRPTSVHEGPSSSSRVITQISRGTRINVVSSAGAWLEVRSKHGNPPGYVPSGDARQIRQVN